MKRLLYTALIIFIAVSANAQDEFQEIQKEWGKEKKEIVGIGMALSDADANKFWPLYDQYEKERQKIGKERIMILNDYAEHYSSMTNAKADELVNRINKNDAALSKLYQQYYTKIKTALNAIQAAKFLQIENYINSTLKLTFQELLPVIGELDHMKKQEL
ncbi:hypothetical protein OCK74_24530 [Chitinophagaceae bacterium LB-8]|uniref:Uncharacterized protein n=1 Tax=Paraflavisolibacter caeni TaxID=2982496 RepID=A0A9X3BHG1_9BACT|nr:hypothetical protein [Paraflavisolibacter caeni]MCU7552309.1 hypothetical protein [Paraflavisolibacter caeni]